MYQGIVLGTYFCAVGVEVTRKRTVEIEIDPWITNNQAAFSAKKQTDHEN